MSTIPPPDREKLLRAALRKHAGTWIQRFYRHEVLVHRTIRGHQAEAVDVFTREVVNPVVQRVAAGLATFDRRGNDVLVEATPELRAIMADAEQIIRRGVGIVEQRHATNVRDLVQHEAEWVTDSARKVLRVDPPAANVQPIMQAVSQRPYLGGKVDEWFGSLVGGDNGAADNVRFAIREGISRGYDQQTIVRMLRGKRDTGYTDGLLSGQNADQVRMLVQSSMVHASSTTRVESFKALGLKQYRWLATLDTKTCPTCAMREAQSPYEVGMGPMPPEHPRCLPGDALVLPIGRIAAVTERWLDGEVCIIRTASGRVLTATPNHPILTTRGWIGAGAIHEGLDVVCGGDVERAAPVHHDGEHVPTAIHEVAKAFLASSETLAVPVPVAAPDFHGDGAGSDVAIVGTNRRLLVDRHAKASQHRGKRIFEVADHARTTDGSSDPLGIGVLRSADGAVCGACHGESLFGAGALHARELLLAAVADESTALAQQADDGRPRRANASGNTGGADAAVEQGQCGGVVLDGERHDGGRPHHGSATVNQSVSVGLADPVRRRDVFDAGTASVGRSNSGVVEILRLEPTRLADAVEDGVDTGEGDSELARDLIDGNVVPVVADKVVAVDRAEFHGMVYNLETTAGAYIANGIVTHNCRCSPAPWLGDPIGTRASTDGPVPAEQTVPEWWEGRSASEQDDILGKTKAAAWRRGDLTLDQMFGKDLQPLSVAELRRLDRLPDDEG